MDDNFNPEKEEYFKVTRLYSTGFIIACIGILILALIPIARAVLGYCKIYLPNAPNWFFTLDLIIGIIQTIGAALIFKLKKLGIWLFCAGLIAVILLYLTAFNAYEIDAVHGLYFFIGYALVPIIPRWKYFK